MLRRSHNEVQQVRDVVVGAVEGVLLPPPVSDVHCGLLVQLMAKTGV